MLGVTWAVTNEGISKQLPGALLLFFALRMSFLERIFVARGGLDWDWSIALLQRVCKQKFHFPFCYQCCVSIFPRKAFAAFIKNIFWENWKIWQKNYYKSVPEIFCSRGPPWWDTEYRMTPESSRWWSQDCKKRRSMAPLTIDPPQHQQHCNISVRGSIIGSVLLQNGCLCLHW